MATLEQQIATLEEKLKQARTRKAQIEARKRAAESKKQRAADTRRKILIGAAVLAKVEQGDWPRERLLDMLNGVLTRDDDRALFELCPLPHTDTTAAPDSSGI